MRRKKRSIEETQEEKEDEKEEDFIETWNKKRLFLFSSASLIVLALVFHYAIGSVQNRFFSPKSMVLGTETVNKTKEVDIPSSKDIDKIIDQAKQDIAKLTSENFTSSEAAIGKIIYDLQQLQGGKKDTKDVFCEMVCKK